MVRAAVFFAWLVAVATAAAAGGVDAQQVTPPLRGTLREPPKSYAPAPMNFKLGRFAGSPACGLNCAEFIYASGEIRADTVEALMILRSRLKRPLPVYFNSPGGNLDGGLALGRMLRSAGMDTHVGALVQVTCRSGGDVCAEADLRSGVTVYSRKIAPALCNSSCVYAFAGGVQRAMAEDSSLGVHRFFLVRADDPLRRPLTEITAADRQKLDGSAGMIADYLQEMGVSREVLDIANTIEPSEIRKLTSDQTVAFKLVTPGFESPAHALMPDPTATASISPATTPEGWPIVTREGRPFLVATLAGESRRFGRIASEIAISCPLNGNDYSLAFREIVRGVVRSRDTARIHAGPSATEMMATANALPRSAAVSAEKTGVLVVQVVSEATAGHPARLEFPGRGLRAGLSLLDKACAGRN